MWYLQNEISFYKKSVNIWKSEIFTSDGDTSNKHFNIVTFEELEWSTLGLSGNYTISKYCHSHSPTDKWSLIWKDFEKYNFNSASKSLTV